mgnify:CR=1 FL=1
MKKIEYLVVIQNWNGEPFIEDCFNSVINY